MFSESFNKKAQDIKAKFPTFLTFLNEWMHECKSFLVSVNGKKQTQAVFKSVEFFKILSIL